MLSDILIYMIIPFCPETLFEINPDYKVTSFENGVLVVDSWYKNYDAIHNVLQNMPVPIWKRHEYGRNFVDYYDCRPAIPVNYPTKKLQDILEHYPQLISKYFNVPNTEHVNQPFEFNYFKNIKKNVSPSLQHFPHTDFNFNCIVYLDRIASGGTAIYEIDSIYGAEEFNLMHDVSNYPKIIIEAKPNRLVIFDGNQYHGGYISNHNHYVDNWRINQVLFFN